MLGPNVEVARIITHLDFHLNSIRAELRSLTHRVDETAGAVKRLYTLGGDLLPKLITEAAMQLAAEMYGRDGRKEEVDRT